MPEKRKKSKNHAKKKLPSRSFYMKVTLRSYSQKQANISDILRFSCFYHACAYHNIRV